jgi:hypothetical protein
MAPRKCHFFADLCTLGVLFSFVVIGLYYSVKNANENYGAGVYVPYILPRDESHYNDVRDFLIANNVSSQLALDTKGSPQNSALFWIAETDDRGLQLDNPHLIQRYVLTVLYYSADGSNWVNRDKYLSDALECQWFGVDCNNETMVVNLTLASNKLAGDLPSELTSLTSLQNLGLSDNKLKKYYFSEEICNNTKLEKLDLSQNELAGEIPFFSSACKELITLKLSKNFFSGMLGRDINKLTNLQYLDLNMNRLSGPVNIFALTKLEDLLLGGNKFNQSLPGSLYWLVNLKNLDLFENEFTGTIHANFERLAKLERLQLAGNQLTGSINPSLGKMANLRDFTLQYNNLTGNVPPDICVIPTLSRLMADCNCEGGNSLDSCDCCTSCCCHQGDSYTCTDV